jgi:hypothetical protein
MPTTTLEGLLPEELKDGLTPAENTLLDKAQKGELADFRTGNEEIDNPENANTWGDDRRIRANLLYWLCIDRGASELVHAKGVRIAGARIGGQLDFESATLPHPLVFFLCAIPETIILQATQTRTLAFLQSCTGPITADRLTTQGPVLLRGTQTNGEIRLPGAKIGGSLDCDGARFANPGGKALFANRLTTQGPVFLRNDFHARGEVDLVDASIGANLECTSATFDNPEGKALSGDRLTTQGAVFLLGTKARGEISLSGAKIGGVLNCDTSMFQNPGNKALNGEWLVVKGGLFWRSIAERPVGEITLMHAKVGQLVDDATSWPLKSHLWLDGFEYEAFGVDSPRTAKERLDWLALQPEKPFHPRPHEQLAKVFRKMGREVDAREVLIAKQEALRKHGELGYLSKAWNKFLSITIAHGYKPWRTMWFMVALILTGSGVFWLAELRQMQQSAPSFNPFVYSLELSLPLIDLHQESYYLPEADQPGGWFFRLYFWVHIILGWVASTLLVAALTGLIRKE